MQLNTQGINSADDVGGNRPLPGRYHVIIQDVDETFQKDAKSIIVDFEVLAGTTPGQEGRRHREYFSVSEKAMPRLIRLAMVTQLIGPNEMREVAFSQARSRQLIIELGEDEYQGKKRTKMSFAGMWEIGHADVKDVPLNQEALQFQANQTPQAAATSQPPTTPPQAQPPQAAPASAVPPQQPAPAPQPAAPGQQGQNAGWGDL